MLIKVFQMSKIYEFKTFSNGQISNVDNGKVTYDNYIEKLVLEKKNVWDIETLVNILSLVQTCLPKCLPNLQSKWMSQNHYICRL